MDEPIWTPSQAVAVERILGWAKAGPFAPREFRLGGLAGTGKTHTAGFLAASLVAEGVRVEFCAPTGRAASILASKSGLPARTVHSILKYGPGGADHDDDCTGGSDCVCAASQTFRKATETDGTRTGQSVIVVDEASMVTRWMYEELMGLGAKILFVGDYGQLPPVGESGFSIVSEDRLDAKLTDIVRQEEGNPILELAYEVRNGGDWGKWAGETTGAGGTSVTVLQRPLASARIGYRQGRMLLAYTNRTRVARNQEIRRRRWDRDYTDVPLPGDVVICLRNDPGRGIFNGQRAIVEKVGPYGDDPNLGLLWAKMETGSDYVGPVVRAQFGSQTLLANEHGGLWDFGYCVTTHKAQGSEADDVMVLGETLFKMPEDDRRRWRYTAVTRAKRNLTIIAPPGRA